MNETAPPSRVAAESAYTYGIPALIGVGVVATLVFAVLLWALVRAVRELAAASRIMGAAVGLVGAARSVEDERAEARHREAMAATADLKATVVARL